MYMRYFSLFKQTQIEKKITSEYKNRQYTVFKTLISRVIDSVSII